jgi:hypothetical protein
MTAYLIFIWFKKTAKLTERTPQDFKKSTHINVW